MFLLGVEGLFFNVFFSLISRMGHLRNNHAQRSIQSQKPKISKKKNRIDLYKGGSSCRSFNTGLPPNIPTYLKIRIADGDIT